ncbi:MAG: aldose epimerase [Coleofasciculaceae cyanobacterium]
MVFAIAKKQHVYESYILTDQDAQSRLEVVPERGGIITSWSIQGKDLLYLDTERFADERLSVRGGIPILFPICGNLPNNTYIHNERKYSLKQHGFARDLAWKVTDQTTSNQAGITLELNSNEQTLAVYPFQFQLAFTYQIKGNTLEIQQQYTNHSNEPMPFATGLHPYFATADKTKLEYKIPSTKYQDQISKEVHPFQGSFDLSQNEIDVAFRQLSNTSASVIDTAAGLKLQLEYSNLYSTLVFWTVKGKDYYCLEPWSALRNALNTGEDLTQLAPGASCQTVVRLTATFL